VIVAPLRLVRPRRARRRGAGVAKALDGALQRGNDSRRKRVDGWCRPWFSTPKWGVRNVSGRFDSCAPPQKTLRSRAVARGCPRLTSRFRYPVSPPGMGAAPGSVPRLRFPAPCPASDDAHVNTHERLHSKAERSPLLTGGEHDGTRQEGAVRPKRFVLVNVHVFVIGRRERSRERSRETEPGNGAGKRSRGTEPGPAPMPRGVSAGNKTFPPANTGAPRSGRPLPSASPRLGSACRCALAYGRRFRSGSPDASLSDPGEGATFRLE
jgi:hypothetical protein